MPSEKILKEKEAFVASLREKMESSVAGVIVDYKGINVADDTKLRKELREAGVEYFVVKNTMLRLAVGKKLGEHWSLGVGFQYSFVQTAMLEHTPARLSTDIGVLYLPVEKLSVGLLIKDFPSVKLNQQGVDLDCFQAFAIQAGFQYEVLEHTLMAFYVGTDQDYRITGGLGIEYAFKLLCINFDEFLKLWQGVFILACDY